MVVRLCEASLQRRRYCLMIIDIQLSIMTVENLHLLGLWMIIVSTPDSYLVIVTKENINWW